jgi:hypothetical protein
MSSACELATNGAWTHCEDLSDFLDWLVHPVREEHHSALLR